jgi:hypothetical protein
MSILLLPSQVKIIMEMKILRKQRGIAIFSIVLALVISLGAIAMVMAVNNPSTRSTAVNNVAVTMTAQANMIRSQIMNCVNGDPATGTTGDNGTALNISFPYTGSAAGVVTGGGVLGTVSSLYCPRTVSGASWIVGASDANLWSGLNGVFLPVPPSGFSAWQFSNTTNLVKISTSYVGTNAESAAAITQAATKFSSSEVSTSTANTFVVCVVLNSGLCT